MNALDIIYVVFWIGVIFLFIFSGVGIYKNHQDAMDKAVKDNLESLGKNLAKTAKPVITAQILIDLGFIHRPNLIQDSWEYILRNDVYKDDWSQRTSYEYKSISLSVCNDKGKGEYYVFLREGDTEERHKDEVLSITRNMLYVEDLKNLIKILKL